MLACHGCGTAHAIEHSIRRPEYKDRLFHLTEPYFDDDAPRYSYSEDKKNLTLKWYMGPPRLSEWKLGPELSTWGTIEPTCIRCGASALTGRWDEDEPCPACHGPMERVGFWGT
jgi:hypothetical protein